MNFYEGNSMTYKCLEDYMIEECSIVTERDWRTVTALGIEVLKDGHGLQKFCSTYEADKPGRQKSKIHESHIQSSHLSCKSDGHQGILSATDLCKIKWFLVCFLGN